MPLAQGRYPQYNPLQALLGDPRNATQANLPARTNLPLGSGVALVDQAVAATGVSISVAVPVEVGDPISVVSFLIGATAESSGTHAFAAIYSGIATPALIAQSADVTGAAALAASARYDFTLASGPFYITAAQAPKGFIYATLCVTATTVPTAVGYVVATGAGYAAFTGAPVKGLCAVTHGSAQAATAAATIASPTAVATAPVVFLT